MKKEKEEHGQQKKQKIGQEFWPRTTPMANPQFFFC